jgi:hypothetical protein
MVAAIGVKVKRVGHYILGVAVRPHNYWAWALLREGCARASRTAVNLRFRKNEAKWTFS